MANVYLGLGTNLGDKASNLHQAIGRIRERIGEVISQSHFYETAPWGFDSANTFLNAALCVNTACPPLEVLHLTQAIERQMGRKQKSANGIYADRIIDIDLLLYDDVILQIRKSRFALLPINYDMIPNTLHEAMANGLPLITTETPGTIKLNKGKRCALVSRQGDCMDIVNNMLELLNNADLAEELRRNAADYEYQRSNNRDICLHWVELYRVCIANKRRGEKIPEKYLFDPEKISGVI